MKHIEVAQKINEVLYSDDYSDPEEKIERLKRIYAENPTAPGKVQKFFDWFMQPMLCGEIKSLEEVEAFNKLLKGYWEAVNARENAYNPTSQVHQHLHLHQKYNQRLEE